MPYAHTRSVFTPRLICTLLLLITLIACDSGSTGPEEATIGPAGGDVTLAGGAVKLSVPPGALSDPIKLSAVLATSYPASELIVPGTVYDIGPSGASFGRMVRLTLSYDPQQLPERVQESELRLFLAVGDGWELAVNATVDAEAHTVFGTISGTGQFAVMGKPVASVGLTPSYYTVEVGGTKQLTGIGLDAAGQSLPGRTVSWSSSNESVATVDGTGLVTATGLGEATITAMAEDQSTSAHIQTWSCSAQTQIPEAECEAVIDLFFLASEDWRLTPTWVPNQFPCEWWGVYCADQHVWALRLQNRGLQGLLPTSIGAFTSLQELNISSNQLAGTIPAAIGNLTKLTSLYLLSDGLTGAIPAGIGDLTELVELHLSGNELTGPIPPEIGNLSNLQTLNLRWNELSGLIPVELANLSNLQDLSLLDNNLTGSIPPELANLSGLKELGLSFNQLTGSIPPELGQLPNLERLGAGRNQLTGSIPAEIGDLANLISLYLDYNQLSGVVPLAVAQLGGRIQARSGGASDCQLQPGGNPALGMPDTEDYRAADQDGDGKICGVTIGG